MMFQRCTTGLLFFHPMGRGLIIWGKCSSKQKKR